MCESSVQAGMAGWAEQTVGYLEFFRRWDTPLDDEAARAFSRLVRNSPDFESFQVLAPVGSDDRKLFLRHIDSFEEAAGLIREGRMSEDLFFDAWYEMPGAWNHARPFVLGMRIETGNPALYDGFEWLAGHAVQFWTGREANPPKWQPIESHAPTGEDEAVYGAFNRIWTGPRDKAGWEFVDALAVRAPDFETFSQIVKRGSEEYIKFDRVFCAYDQAGTLMKNGILHPAIFFRFWRSPNEIWAFSESWVKGLREKVGSPHLYENVYWLVEYERVWRTRQH